MKERPILFSAPMVNAILAGAKTQTRRVIKPQQPRETQPLDAPYEFELTERNGDVTLYTTEQLVERCPYGKPGDRLWVRETFGVLTGNGIRTVYRADGEPMTSGGTELVRDMKWHPSIFMRRQQSRITLEVTGVRVERLHDIAEKDAWAEGIECVDGMLDDAAICRAAKVLGCCIDDGRATLGALWAEINGEESLAANPWLWVVDFQRCEEGRWP